MFDGFVIFIFLFFPVVLYSFVFIFFLIYIIWMHDKSEWRARILNGLSD